MALPLVEGVAGSRRNRLCWAAAKRLRASRRGLRQRSISRNFTTEPRYCRDARGSDAKSPNRGSPPSDITTTPETTRHHPETSRHLRGHQNIPTDYATSPKTTRQRLQIRGVVRRHCVVVSRLRIITSSYQDVPRDYATSLAATRHHLAASRHSWRLRVIVLGQRDVPPGRRPSSRDIASSSVGFKTSPAATRRLRAHHDSSASPVSDPRAILRRQEIARRVH